MNGGVLHCVEVLSDEELQDALRGYEYFGIDVDRVFQRAKTAGKDEWDDIESKLDADYEDVADDGTLMAAFQAHYAANPDAYARVED